MSEMKKMIVLQVKIYDIVISKKITSRCCFVFNTRFRLLRLSSLFPLTDANPTSGF